MQYWGLTDPGCVRPQNQDAYQVVQLDKNTLLCVVCDGMGGAKSGNVASTLTADVFVQEIKRTWKPGMDQEAVDLISVSFAESFGNKERLVGELFQFSFHIIDQLTVASDPVITAVDGFKVIVVADLLTYCHHIEILTVGEYLGKEFPGES